MKVAFLVLAHRSPQHLARLCRILGAEGDPVFVHLDAKSPIAPFEAELAGLTVRMVQQIKVHHGGYSQVAAINLLIDAALGSSCDYLFLLSGQCFPIRPIAWLKAKLEAEGGDFINLFPLPRPRNAKDLARLEHHYIENRSESRLLRFAQKLLLRLPPRNVVAGMGLWPHGGSTWWCVRRSTAEYFAWYRRRYPRFDRFLRSATYVDEVYYHSILATMGDVDAVHPALFWTEFDPSTHHPYIWGAKDIERLLAQDAFLVRKVDAEEAPDLVAQLEVRLAMATTEPVNRVA